MTDFKKEMEEYERKKDEKLQKVLSEIKQAVVTASNNRMACKIDLDMDSTNVRLDIKVDTPENMNAYNHRMYR